MFQIKRASREAAPVFAAFIGGPGSGKTYSALLFARGLVGPKGRIGVIDAEGGRSLVYADDPDIGGFEHLDLIEPYSSDRFRLAVKEFISHGIDCIIIDSASHEHEAVGGMLDFADQEEARGTNKRMKWVRPKMQHNRFIRTALSCGAHMIFCIREKTIVDTDTKPPTRIVLPVCESNLPYEFMISIHMRDEGIAEFQKVPKPFQKYIRQGERVTVEHGALLMQEAGKGQDTSKILAIVHNLEDAASSGSEVFKTAWMAAWRNAGPEGDNKTVTADRAELQKNLDRLKRIASDADLVAGDDDADREPGDIGKFDKPADKPADPYEDDGFPGDR